MKFTIKIIISLLAVLLVFSGAPTNAQQNDGLMFIENVGQFDPPVQYQANLGGATLRLTDDALWLTLVEPLNIESADVEASSVETVNIEARKGVNLKLSFVDANPQPRIEPFGPLNTPVSFFRGGDPGNWQSNVPVWSRVRYVDLYPDTDLEISSQNGQLSLRLVTKNGDVPEQVQLQVEGADEMMLNNSGYLQLTTTVGQVDLPLLQAVDESDNLLNTPAPTLNGNVIANPFASSPLRLAASPDVSIAGVSDLIYSTFLGGEGNLDYGYGITIDDAGYAYVTGQAEPGFPSTPGAFDPDIDGVYNDIFIAKLTPDGSDLIFATFLGGSDWETSYGIRVDGSGDIYVVGHTTSTDFPTTPGAFDDSLAGPADTFVTKLNPTGTALIYSTLIGGFESDYGWDMALDDTGHVYVTGTTSSTDFPTTPDALDDTNNNTDAFVVKLNSDGSNLDYASFLGGSGFDNGHGIALDPEGYIYVAGRTGSDDYPTTPGALDTSYYRNEGFVTKLTPDGSAIVYSTMIGGNDVDDVEALAVDDAGHAYITGSTRSTDFPTTPNAISPTCSECASLIFSTDSFVAKLGTDGTTLAYSTYLGGNRPDYGQDIAVSENGRAYVTGYSYSFDFPTTPDAFDPICDSCDEGEYTFTRPDAFVTRVSPDGSVLEYSTFLGGSDGPDLGTTLAIDNSGNVYATGFTHSNDFPVTAGAFDTLFEGYYEVFVSKLATGSDEPEPVPTPTPTPQAPPVPPHNCGPTPLGEVAVGDTPRGVDVDPQRERVYVANSSPGSVSVIDGSTNVVMQSIAPISSATGVAYDPAQNIIWVSNSSADTLTPIQANTDATGFSVLPAIPVGEQPWGVAYEPLHNYVYVVNNLSESVTVVDAISQTVVATLTGSFNAPWHVAANPTTGKVYVANSGNNSVTVIDGTSVSGVVSLYDSGSPYGIAVDEMHNVVYVATVQSHRIVAVGDLWGQADQFLGWASFQRGYNPNRPVPLRAIAVNPQVATGDGGHVWATTSTGDGSEANQALFIPKGWVNRFHVPFTQNVGPEPKEGIAINRLTNRVYVTSGTSPGTVTVIGDHDNVCPGIAPASVKEDSSQITLDIYSVVSLTRSDAVQDGVINILDLTFVATNYGTGNIEADVTGDGRVDIFDLTTIAANFGREVPGFGGK